MNKFIRLTVKRGMVLVPVRDLKWMSEIKADDPSGELRTHYANGDRTRCELPKGEIAYFTEDLSAIHELIRAES